MTGHRSARQKIFEHRMAVRRAGRPKSIGRWGAGGSALEQAVSDQSSAHGAVSWHSHSHGFGGPAVIAIRGTVLIAGKKQRRGVDLAKKGFHQFSRWLGKSSRGSPERGLAGRR